MFCPLPNVCLHSAPRSIWVLNAKHLSVFCTQIYVRHAKHQSVLHPELCAFHIKHHAVFCIQICVRPTPNFCLRSAPRIMCALRQTLMHFSACTTKYTLYLSALQFVYLLNEWTNLCVFVSGPLIRDWCRVVYPIRRQLSKLLTKLDVMTWQRSVSRKVKRNRALCGTSSTHGMQTKFEICSTRQPRSEARRLRHTTTQYTTRAGTWTMNWGRGCGRNTMCRATVYYSAWEMLCSYQLGLLIR